MDTLPTKLKILNEREWKTAITQFEKETSQDYTVISRIKFIELENAQLKYQFEEEAGKNYTLKFLSRKLDSLSRIDFVPTGFSAEVIPVATRMSAIRLKKKNNYFLYTFDYTRPKDVQYVSILFNGIEYPNKNPNDFVLFLLKKK